MAHDAFVSYSSKDKPVADAVVAALEARGVRCWVAPRDIAPGSDYGAAIIEGINGSRVMVLIFSGHSNSSPQVIREVERAVNKQLHIIPFRIEPAEMTKAMEYYISSPHWLDAITPPLDAHIDRLAASVRTIVGETAAAPRPIVTPSPPAVRSGTRPRSPAIMIGAGIAVVGLITASVLFWHRFHRAPERAGGGQSPTTLAAATSPTTGPTGVRSSAALLALPVTDGLVRRFELGADDEQGSMGRLFLSPDGSRLVAGPFENEQGYPTAAAWDTISGRPLFRVKGVHAISASGDVDKVFLATRWEGIGVRDVSTGAQIGQLEVAPSGIVAEWSHDGRMLAVAGGRKVGLFDTEGVKLRDLASEAADGGIWRMGFSPDDKALVLAGASASRVECRSPRSGAILWTHDAAVSRAMTQVASQANRVRICRDRTWILDGKDGKPLLDLDVTWQDTIVELSPDGAWLVGTTRDADAAAIKFWSVDDKQELSRFHGVTIAKPTVLQFTPDSHRLLVCTGEGKLIVLDIATGRQVAAFKGGSSPIYGMSLSADGRFAATNGGDGNVVWLWRLPE